MITGLETKITEDENLINVLSNQTSNKTNSIDASFEEAKSKLFIIPIEKNF